MNEDVGEDRKLFWKEVSKVNGGKVETQFDILIISLRGLCVSCRRQPFT